ncbi:MAG: energy transducer TonB [Pelomonas sp.]|nr:energy transducer TonB [Roseateles sp.]
MKLSGLQIALLVSASLHAGVLAIRIAAPDTFKRVFEDQPLEVILVNTRSNEAPAKATALAQANLAGGGEVDRGRATSPLPPSKLLEIGEQAEESHAQITQLQQEQQQLLTLVRRELAKLPDPDPLRRDTAQAQDEAEHRRQLVQLLAEIEKRVNEENARPRKRYVSPATREVVYAGYYDGLRRRIEDRGTRDFPELNGRKLYGALTMNIQVDYRGRVVETEIVVSSGNPLLDRRAIAIVQACAPFAPFTPAMRRGAEVLVITSRFRFTREDGLETQLGNALSQ